MKIGLFDHVERADHAAGSGRVGIDMQMHVDGADERGIGQAEIDRAAQRIDLPLVGRRSVLDAAGAGRECQDGSSKNCASDEPRHGECA